MNCTSPPELDEGQLLKYLDGTADQKTKLHIGQCEYCKNRAAILEELQAELRWLAHPSPLELGEFHLRMLPPGRALVVSRHLSECPHCVDEISKLEESLVELTPRPIPIQITRTLIARLVGTGTGTGSAPASIAVRGGAESSPRFEVDDFLIRLGIAPALDQQLSIQGLMIAKNNQDQWTNATVELNQNYLAPLISSVNRFGTFTFEAVYPGWTHVKITSPDGITVQTETVNITL